MWVDLAIGIGVGLALGVAAWLAMREPPANREPSREALHRRADALGRELDRQARDPQGRQS